MKYDEYQQLYLVDVVKAGKKFRRLQLMSKGNIEETLEEEQNEKWVECVKDAALCIGWQFDKPIVDVTPRTDGVMTNITAETFGKGNKVVQNDNVYEILSTGVTQEFEAGYSALRLVYADPETGKRERIIGNDHVAMPYKYWEHSTLISQKQLGELCKCLGECDEIEYNDGENSRSLFLIGKCTNDSWVVLNKTTKSFEIENESNWKEFELRRQDHGGLIGKQLRTAAHGRKGYMIPHGTYLKSYNYEIYEYQPSFTKGSAGNGLLLKNIHTKQQTFVELERAERMEIVSLPQSQARIMSVGTLKTIVMKLAKEYNIVDNTGTMNSLAGIEYTYSIIEQETAKLQQRGNGKKEASITTSFGDQTLTGPGWENIKLSSNDKRNDHTSISREVGLNGINTISTNNNHANIKREIASNNKSNNHTSVKRESKQVGLSVRGAGAYGSNINNTNDTNMNNAYATGLKQQVGSNERGISGMFFKHFLFCCLFAKCHMHDVIGCMFVKLVFVCYY